MTHVGNWGRTGRKGAREKPQSEHTICLWKIQFSIKEKKLRKLHEFFCILQNLHEN